MTRRSIIHMLQWLPAVVATGWLASFIWDTDNGDAVNAMPIDQGVVRVFVTGPRGDITGTGLVVDDDGHVATNFHVIQSHLENDWPLAVGEPGRGSDERLSRLDAKAATEPPLSLK